MVGYHAAAGSEANALAHTLSLDAARIRLNGREASEFLIHAYAAATVGVPVVFVAGDAGLMREIESVDPTIQRCAVKEGSGASTISMVPEAARQAIFAGVKAAVRGAKKAQPLALDPEWALEICYNDPSLATRHQHYPGARHIGDRTIRMETTDYMNVLRMLNYVT